MSRGAGKLQRAILARLAGRGCTVFRGGGTMTTCELTDELQDAGLVPDDRAASAFRVRRACMALYHAGKLSAERRRDYDRRVNCWEWTAVTPEVKRDAGPGTAHDATAVEAPCRIDPAAHEAS